MDTKDGRIYTPEQIKGLLKSNMNNDMLLVQRLVEMKTPPTGKQMKRVPPRVKGYERCPCGSGKLFKNCCKV